MFFMKILLILPKLHEKTHSRPGDIKFFCQGRRMFMHNLPPFIGAVLSEERQLLKWVGIFQVGIFRGEFDGWGFSRWEFSQGEFS